MPPIVDREVFNKVQSILALRSPKVTWPRSISSEYLLGGMMRCVECGSGIIGQAAKSGQFSYYRCGNALRRGSKACPGRWLPKEKIESFIIDKIKEYILTYENLTELVRLTNEEIDTLSSKIDEKLKRLDQGIHDANIRLNRLYEALESGELESEELAPRIKALVARKAELERIRLEMENEA